MLASDRGDLGLNALQVGRHDLQQAYGDQIAYYVTVGGLQVTARDYAKLGELYRLGATEGLSG